MTAVPDPARKQQQRKAQGKRKILRFLLVNVGTFCDGSLFDGILASWKDIAHVDCLVDNAALTHETAKLAQQVHVFESPEFIRSDHLTRAADTSVDTMPCGAFLICAMQRPHCHGYTR
jgi:hypothetical protein